MPWIACDVRLPIDPKTVSLAMAMGWTRKETVANLFMLWIWSLDFAPDGDLSGFSHDLIAEGIGIPMADGDRLVEALVKSRWLDDKPYLRLHDWWSLVGLFLRGRYRNEPKRWQRIQKLYELPANARISAAAPDKEPSGTALEQVYATVHNSTIHESNSTEPPPLRPAPELEERDDDDDEVSKTIVEDLKILKREIIRRSGMRRISSTDEERLIRLLKQYGERVVEACRTLHGGVENIPAYLATILDGKDDTAELARRVEARLKKGVG